jgi:putative Holliday junction resolvase
VTFAGTLIGFDFGERRIGVAVADTGWPHARAIGVIRGSTNDARFAAIDKLEREWRPVAFVVGQPRHADGSPHELARLASKFGRRLAARYRVPVVLVDETLTSVEAQAQIRDEGSRPRRGAQSEVDAVAAKIILQSYLDDPGGREHVAPRS